MRHASESEQQVTFFDWVRLRERTDERYQQIYAVPNGQLRQTAVACRLRQEGVRKGVLDINVDVPSGRFHGAKIEMKVEGRYLTKEQREAAQRNERFGYAVKVAHSAGEAMIWLMAYLGESRQEIHRIAKQMFYSGDIPDPHEGEVA